MTSSAIRVNPGRRHDSCRSAELRRAAVGRRRHHWRMTSLPAFWSFNRRRDAHLIATETVQWRGPFSWPGYGNDAGPPVPPDGPCVYLLTFSCGDGHLLRSVGVTSALRRRLREHERRYLDGSYTILDVDAAHAGLRVELWHGWGYAKSHPEQRRAYRDFIRAAARDELTAYRLFMAVEPSQRRRERIEFSIAHAAYASRQFWGDLIDGGMSLRGRNNNEIPVRILNTSLARVDGLPSEMEI